MLLCMTRKRQCNEEDNQTISSRNPPSGGRGKNCCTCIVVRCASLVPRHSCVSIKVKLPVCVWVTDA